MIKEILHVINDVLYLANQPLAPWYVLDLIKGLNFTLGLMALAQAFKRSKFVGYGLLLLLLGLLLIRSGAQSTPLTFLQLMIQSGFVLIFYGLWLRWKTEGGVKHDRRKYY